MIPLETISFSLEDSVISVFINDDQKLGEIQLTEEELNKYGFTPEHQKIQQMGQEKYKVHFSDWGEVFHCYFKDNRYWILCELTNDEYFINSIMRSYFKANARYFGLDRWTQFKLKMKRFFALD